MGLYMAAKGNQNAKGNKGGGRPSSYKDEFAQWAEKLAKLGATDADLADAFEVSEMTINRWKNEHPEFLLSLKKGKLFADAEVASKLFHRATGYDHPEDDIRTVSLPDGGGSEIVITPTIKHYPPDTTACIFWLKNRQPEKWREKREPDAIEDIAEVLKEAVSKLPY